VSTRYQFGRFEVRPAERQLLVDGGLVPLGARAFDVLLTLIERRDRIVTKDELLEIAWPGLIVEENNLQVQVSLLRKHLGPRAVVTIPGRGYQFALEPEADKKPASPSRVDIPWPITSFVGRERERAALKSHLAQNRLVTVLGMGGVGKTRLALQVALETADRYADGPRFVELAAVADGDGIAHATANALDVRPDPARSPIEALVRYVRERELLIILDNCEHLLQSCASFVRKVLEAAPRVVVLATSRQALRISGEAGFPLSGLGVPATIECGACELSSGEAVQLFVERAKAVSPSFGLTPSNATKVVDLCRRLDGIPLALELAAVRLRALSLDAIAARLDRRFLLLKVAAPSSAPRHQALRACLDWSHELLTEPERVVLRRLAVFVGGCTINAAEAVAAGGLIAPGDVIDIVASLVEKSMVAHDARTDRYGMLETVRQYALERLAESDDRHETQARHVRYYVELAESASPHLAGADPRPWFAALDAERENLLAAHAFCDGAEDGAELGLRLAVALFMYWANRAVVALAIQTTLKALARPGVERHGRLRASATAQMGQLAFWSGDYPSARQYLENALAAAIDIGDNTTVVHAHRRLASLCHSCGDRAAARAHFEACIALRETVHESLFNLCLMCLGHLHVDQDEFDVAERLYAQAMAVLTEEAYPHQHAVVLFVITTMDIKRGREGAARKSLGKSARIIERLDLYVLRPLILEIAAAIAALEGDPERTARYLGAAGAEVAQTRLHFYPPVRGTLAPFIRDARNAIGAEAFAAAEARGAAMSYDDAMAEARDWLAGEPKTVSSTATVPAPF